ncbi:hypothetical protein EJA72_29540 [Pseudomonas sp. PB120]|nr:hypothetical protein [Pseudomonas sp. PB120]
MEYICTLLAFPWQAFVGASLLAKNAQAPRSSRQRALSLASIASKLAPTGGFFRGRVVPGRATGRCRARGRR